MRRFGVLSIRLIVQKDRGDPVADEAGIDAAKMSAKVEVAKHTAVEPHLMQRRRVRLASVLTRRLVESNEAGGGGVASVAVFACPFYTSYAADDLSLA